MWINLFPFLNATHIFLSMCFVQVTLGTSTDSNIAAFREEVLAHMSEPPWNYTAGFPPGTKVTFCELAARLAFHVLSHGIFNIPLKWFKCIFIDLTKNVTSAATRWWWYLEDALSNLLVPVSNSAPYTSDGGSILSLEITSRFLFLVLYNDLWVILLNLWFRDGRINCYHWQEAVFHQLR